MRILISVILLACSLLRAGIDYNYSSVKPDTLKNDSLKREISLKGKSKQLSDSLDIVIQNEFNIEIQTKNLPNPNKVVVIIPKDHSKKNYPLIFMLHGWSGDQNQWKTTADLHYYADKYNFIIVCPDGLYDSWYVDNPMSHNINYEKYFFEDLFITIKKNYKIDTHNIFITGLSMGGFGSMTFFLNHPKFFRAAASTSGILDITKFKGKWGMDKVFTEENYIKYSPINNLQKIKGLNKKILVDCGEQDFAFKVNQEFYKKCKELKIPILFYSGEGNHSHTYWKKSVERHFDFFNKMTDK
ncbi:MAG: alpha/beta hydrolase family protein [Bacteroidota bacterium]|nr:alpha/beta hydrolase family protein [Bacteroidota bacterium]